jgi:hypothetical protein
MAHGEATHGITSMLLKRNSLSGVKTRRKPSVDVYGENTAFAPKGTYRNDGGRMVNAGQIARRLAR